jgi:glutaminyl-tRNA synthetase
MSIKSQLALVRIAVLQNLIHDPIHLDSFKSILFELKATEKNETVLSLLNQI